MKIRDRMFTAGAFLCALLCAVVLLLLPQAAHAAQTQLADEGRATLDVVVAPDASDDVRELAQTLADYLARITGGEFKVATGDGSAGIAVGHVTDFASLNLADNFKLSDARRREDYLLRSHAKGVYVLGATEQAVSHAVWDLLHRVGHRRYFAPPRWEIVPAKKSLAIDVDDFESPDFLNRSIINGGGYFDYDKQAHTEWRATNRNADGFIVPTSHVYDLIIIQNKAVFEEHPEWLALIDGKRVKHERDGTKFCISNPELRQFVEDWAVKHLEASRKRRPEIGGVSMEPSDGTNWCECEPCAQLGSVTDRVITLANQVAVRLNEENDGPTFVGVLAYGEHSPPPSVRPHPNLVMSVTKGFLRGGYRYEELLDLWGKTGVTLGTYDYLGVLQWSWDQPGVGRSTRSTYAATTLPAMYESGVRLYRAEAESNWGPAGLNYYVIARALWDLDELERVDAMWDEFLANCFGDAAEPMGRFYALIDGSNQPMVSADLVGRMYRALDDAWRAEDDPAVRQRVADLVFYTRYVEIYQAYKQTAPDERQAAFEKLMKFCIANRDRMMVHTRELHRNIRSVDKHVKLPDDAYYRIPYDRNAWAKDEPLDIEQMPEVIAQGVSNNDLFAFEPRRFSSELVPATPLGLADADAPRGAFKQTQTLQEFYVWVDEPAKPIALKVTGGMIRHYRDRGEVRIELYDTNSGDADEDPPAIDEARVPPDGEPRDITLRPQRAGLHRIEVDGGGDMQLTEWAPGLKVTALTPPGARTRFYYAWSAWFYVPKGTKSVAGFADHGSGHIVNPAGEKVFDFTTMSNMPGFFNVPVGEGQDGRVWRFVGVHGSRQLMTVPPALALRPDELLLPREVVEADR